MLYIVRNKINHNSQHYSKFYLAEHHIYGSSRVGIRSYPSSQYYVFTDFEKGTPTDSITLTGRRPWYSLEYNYIIIGQEGNRKL